MLKENVCKTWKSKKLAVKRNIYRSSLCQFELTFGLHVYRSNRKIYLITFVKKREFTNIETLEHLHQLSLQKSTV